MKQPTQNRFFIHTFLIAGYICLGLFGLQFAFHDSSISPIWPPSGFALAYVLFFGKQVRYTLFAVATFTSLLPFIDYQFPALSVLVIVLAYGLGNTIDAYLGAWLIRQQMAYNNLLRSNRNIAWFLLTTLIATLPSSFIAILIGLATQVVSTGEALQLGFTWYIGGVTGILIVTPLLIAFRFHIHSLTLSNLLEFITVQALSIGWALLIFNNHTLFGLDTSFLTYSLLLPTLYSLLRFRACGGISSMAWLSVIAVWSCINQAGPYAKYSQEEALLLVQIFIIIICVSTLLFTSAINELNSLKRYLLKYNQHLLDSLQSKNIELLKQNDELSKQIELREQVEDRQNIAEKIAQLGYWEWDKHSNKMWWSREMFSIFAQQPDHYTPEQSSFLRFFSQKDQDALTQIFTNSSLLQDGAQQLEAIISISSYEQRYVTIVLKPLFDKAHQLNKILGVTQDITERKKAEERIQQQALYDDLTNLPNRRLLQERIQREIARCQRTQCYSALIFLDLDDFKTINDSLGHHIGDSLLQQVAQRLLSKVRIDDTVSRLGGDEFVVLLSRLGNDADTASSLAYQIVEKIKSEIRKSFQLENVDINITASYGISVFPMYMSDKAADIIRRADIAMYKAKQSGQNQSRFFSEEMQKQAQRHLDVQVMLRQALRDSQLELYYQPLFDHKLRVCGLEALMRWRHPDEGFISPEEFINIAERSELIFELSQWLLNSACHVIHTLAKNDLMHHVKRFSINISPKQFQQPNFVDSILSTIKQHQLQPSLFELEITERLLVEHIDQAIDKMNALKKHKIQFAIDDFGTGYSSLSYLKKFPLNRLKIDRSFVQDITTDQNDARIVETIIAMAHHLNLEVIAEGVETQAQLDFLLNHQCKEFQGFLLAKPMPLSQLIDFLQQDQQPPERACNISTHSG